MSTAAHSVYSTKCCAASTWTLRLPTPPIRKSVAEALTPSTRLVWLETPTNPFLRVTDIRAVAEIVHAHPNKPSAGGGQHLCHALSSTPAGTGRGHRRPFDDQISGRTFGCGWRRGDRQRRRSLPKNSPSCKTRSAPCSDRWTASWSCAASRPCPSAWTGTPRMPWRSLNSWKNIPKWKLDLSVPCRPSAAEDRQAANEERRRDDLLHHEAGTRGGDPGGRDTRRYSRWPNRWAAWSR